MDTIKDLNLAADSEVPSAYTTGTDDAPNPNNSIIMFNKDIHTDNHHWNQPGRT